MPDLSIDLHESTSVSKSSCCVFHKAGYDENIELDKKGGVKESCLDDELVKWAVAELGTNRPENWWLEDEISFWDGLFAGAILIWMGEINVQWPL